MSGQDRFLHNLEHRGSLENGARALFSFALLLLVVGGAFGLLFANSTVLGDLLTANSTALATRMDVTLTWWAVEPQTSQPKGKVRRARQCVRSRRM